MWVKSSSIPEIVQSNVNRSRKWFSGTVVEKSLLPPASVPELSVNEGIFNGKRNPGELRLTMYRMAICAKVSKDAMHFCISGVTGIFRLEKSWKVNFSLNQI